MRHDLPQELPRRRVPGEGHSAPPLEPSPVEQRREHLAARADDRRPPTSPVQVGSGRTRAKLPATTGRVNPAMTSPASGATGEAKFPNNSSACRCGLRRYERWVRSESFA